MSDSSTRIIIEFTENLKSELGSETGFTIMGKRREYCGGSLIDDSYAVSKIGTYGDNKKSIFIDISPLTRFNNAIGEIVVTYDSSKGGILGLGGPVQSFVVKFIPTDLMPIDNPHNTEYLTGGLKGLNVNLISINYKDGNSNEYLKSRISSLNIKLTKVGTGDL